MKAMNGVMRQSLAIFFREGREEGLSEELIFELRPKKMKTSQSLKGLWQYFPGWKLPMIYLLPQCQRMTIEVFHE